MTENPKRFNEGESILAEIVPLLEMISMSATYYVVPGPDLEHSPKFTLGSLMGIL